MSSERRRHPGSAPTTFRCDAVHLAGQVAAGADVREQTTAVLSAIDSLLARLGLDRSRVRSAIIWLANIDDRRAVEGEWKAWLDGRATPAIAVGEVQLSDPDHLVEILVTAGR